MRNRTAIRLVEVKALTHRPEGNAPRTYVTEIGVPVSRIAKMEAVEDGWAAEKAKTRVFLRTPEDLIHVTATPSQVVDLMNGDA